MKKIIVQFCLPLILTLMVNSVLAQNSSNKGKDFWVAYSGHIDNLNSRLTLFLSADQATTYEVKIGNTIVSSGTIPANTCLPVIINPNTVPVYIATSDVVETNKAIRVTATKAISLYSIISNSARTGGTMVLPSNTLGKEYYTFSYQSATNANFAQFTIIATEDATQIEITPTKNEATSKHLANQTFTKTLNKGEIYQYQSSTDLSGSRIRSVNGCKPIAVFSGNTWASFCELGSTRNPNGGDNLYQQLFPVSAWGKKFVTAPFYNNLYGNTDILRIIVSEDNTVITVNGSTTSANGTSLANPYAKGSIVTFFSTRANVISSSKPISVAQYQTSQTCNLNNPANNQGTIAYPGDPEITVLNPVEQTLNSITVYSKLQNVPTNINKFFLNVIIRTADAASFRLDGNPVAGFVAIDAEYSYVIIDVTNLQPQHRLTATGGFSAIAYGYGNVESYAYLAGANVQDFTFQLEKLSTSESISIGCINENIKLKINLPYQASKLVWDINNGDGAVTQTSPSFSDSFQRNGETYYTYYYPNPIVYTKVGDYSFTVTSTKPSADACGGTEELTAEFTVDPIPIANFTTVKETCADKVISFTDKSSANVTDKVLTKWQWDFGDGTTSTLQNPTHTYSNGGKYAVKLIVGAENACFSEVFSQEVNVYYRPVSTFNVSRRQTCVNTEMSFTDQSTIAEGTIVKWTWDMGDGSPLIIKTNALPFNYAYATPGDYLVKLTTESDKGCISANFELTIKVTVLPTVDFNLPEVCLADAQAVFANFALNADGTTNGLTYTWDYGDPTSGALNASTERDGKHKYNAAGNYDVTLTINTTNGCRVVLKKQFTVNGSLPKADFEFEKNNICSNKPIILINKSSVDFGRVTKVVWFFDDVKQIEDEEPTPNKIYTYNYPLFSSPAMKQVNVKMIVYSGEVCTNEITKQITLLAAPVVSFNALTSVCLNAGNIQFLATETGNVPGKGVFTGNGVSENGLFNPIVAGAGLHDITYTFTSNAGCVDAITQRIEVFPLPTISAGPETYILVGGEKRLDATASGDIVSYKWTPAIGLNKYDILNPIASPTIDTKYTLTVTSSKGCEVSSQVFVRVLQNINPPNSFTPNGDGMNDVWNIKYLDTYPNTSVEIFNRNGDRVFYSRGYTIPFDGNFNNKPLPVGTYYYIINPNSGRKSITGALTIIR